MPRSDSTTSIPRDDASLMAKSSTTWLLDGKMGKSSKPFVELPQEENASLLIAEGPRGTIGHSPYDRAGEANVSASCGSRPLTYFVARKPLQGTLAVEADCPWLCFLQPPTKSSRVAVHVVEPNTVRKQHAVLLMGKLSGRETSRIEVCIERVSGVGIIFALPGRGGSRFCADEYHIEIGGE